MAAERAAEEVARGFTAVKFDPAGPYTAMGGHQPRLVDIERSVTFVRTDPRGGRRAGRPAGGHARAVHGRRRGALRPPHRPVRPAVVRGAGAARRRPGAGQGGGAVAGADRDRRAVDDQVRVRTRARGTRGGDRAARPRARRRAAGGQEDRRAGGGVRRPGRAALLPRPDRAGRQHPAGDVLAQLPDPGVHPGRQRLPRRPAAPADHVGERPRDPVDRARAGRRARTRTSPARIPTRATDPHLDVERPARRDRPVKRSSNARDEGRT